jgi:hypothetical protein
LLTKFKKNKEYESFQRLMVEKEAALVKKLIKNVTTAYKDIFDGVVTSDELENITNNKWENVDIREV